MSIFIRAPLIAISSSSFQGGGNHIHSDAVSELIRRRRSIKPSQFNTQRIDDSVVSVLLENANWAPTHGMTEPWRFFVFSDTARESLGHALAGIYRTITPMDVLKPAKADKLVESCRRSSHVIAVAMKRQDSRKIPEIEEIEAVACAVQNLHLTATAYGLAGYWSSGKAICSDQFRDFLTLGPDDRILGLFYLGYTDDEWPDGHRSPAADKIQWFRE
ncbi:MAG: nitroreductase [Fuerstiella sp.]|nr:nitroreductase [Fuerstiella sp.]